MALLLRKTCQPILDDADLDAFHVDINNVTKGMCLYTPCGKLFAAVHGVVFGRMLPTAEEISYAAELLAVWLLRNKLKIDGYIDAFAKAQLFGDVDKPIIYKGYTVKVCCDYDWRTDNTTGTRERFYSPKSFNITNRNKVTAQFTALGEVVNIDYSEQVVPSPYVKSTIFPFSAEAIGHAISVLDTAVLAKTAAATVNDILGELNNCET